MRSIIDFISDILISIITMKVFGNPNRQNLLAGSKVPARVQSGRTSKNKAILDVLPVALERAPLEEKEGWARMLYHMARNFGDKPLMQKAMSTIGQFHTDAAKIELLSGGEIIEQYDNPAFNHSSGETTITIDIGKFFRN